MFIFVVMLSTYFALLIKKKSNSEMGSGTCSASLGFSGKKKLLKNMPVCHCVCC